MRVLTWNLWWQYGPWQQRQPAIVEELLAVDADLVLLQEVWAAGGADQVDELASAAGLASVRTVAPGGKPHKFGNAVLSRWPIERLEQVELPGVAGEPSYRNALACRVAAPVGPVLAVVTHLAWQYDQSQLRCRQLAEVVALIARHRSDNPAHPPVILGGDLNAVPDSDEVRRLTGLSQPYAPGLVFTDCWAAAGDGPGFTWSRDNPHAADALWPRRRIDYVFVSWPRAKPLGNPVAAEVIGRQARRGVVPSDHYGVLVELDDRSTGDEGPR
jgi:endonuclease/exonuclease/phosphatase family metal-dependent hydrolase